MPSKQLPIDLIKMDGDTQSRIGINEETVEEYAELIQPGPDGWPFPPCIVFLDGSDHWLADGFHRVLAGVRAKRGSVPCEIRKGTQLDARFFAMTANDKNGLRLTRADKHANIVWLLERPEKRTQKEIAHLCGVTDRTVRNVISERKRAETGEWKPSEKRKVSAIKTGGDDETIDTAKFCHVAKLRADWPDGFEGDPCQNCRDEVKRPSNWWVFKEAFDAVVCACCNTPQAENAQGKPGGGLSSSSSRTPSSSGPASDEEFESSPDSVSSASGNGPVPDVAKSGSDSGKDGRTESDGDGTSQESDTSQARNATETAGDYPNYETSKKDEPCPVCGSEWWRPLKDGGWDCDSCGHPWGEPAGETVGRETPDAKKLKLAHSKVIKSIEAAMRYVDDYHELQPNRAKHKTVMNALQDVALVESRTWK